MSIQTITPAELSRLSERGQAFKLLDVRTPAEFSQVHAVGARSLPLDELDAASVNVFREGSDELVYVICQSGGRSATACQRLGQVGVQGMVSVEGGTDAWARAGLPVVRGASRVISLERQVRLGAGLLVLIGSILTWAIHPAFLILPTLIGAGLIFSGISGFCGMAMVLGKMPWNRRAAVNTASCAST